MRLSIVVDKGAAWAVLPGLSANAMPGLLVSDVLSAHQACLGMTVDSRAMPGQHVLGGEDAPSTVSASAMADSMGQAVKSVSRGPLGRSARTSATRRSHAAAQAGAPMVRSGLSANAMPGMQAATAASARTAYTRRIAGGLASGIRRAAGMGGVWRTGAASARQASPDPTAACAPLGISAHRAKERVGQLRAVEEQGDARMEGANASRILPGPIARYARL